jgi:hypothetical protein
MSMFENGQYCWRETYFVLFDSSRRPSLEKVQKALAAVSSRFTLTNLTSDESGRAESLTVLAPDDFAALDVCYLEGEEVLEQGAQLADDMQALGCRPEDRDRLQRIRSLDARFDVLHFEQVVDFCDDESDEMLDPTALLVVLDALVKLTGGIAIDPQAGAAL